MHLKKLKQLTEKILEKWPYKLLCLGLAIIVYILHSSMEYDSKTFSIPIDVIENGAVLNLDSAVKKVQIVVRADSDTISNIHESDFTASVNLNNIAKSGEYQLPIIVTVKDEISDNYVFEVKKNPQSLKLNVEKKDISYIKLEPIVTGVPAHGFEVSKISIEPEYVEVVGPESMLKQTQKIKTENIDLTDKKSDFSVNVKNKNVNPVLMIQDKGPYTVRVEIATSKMDKKYENTAISFKGLSSDLILIGEYPGITFTLNGSVNSLEEYEIMPNSVYVDLSEIHDSGVYDLPVQFSIPGYYVIKDKSFETISVTIEKIPETLVLEPAAQEENAGD